MTDTTIRTILMRHTGINDGTPRPMPLIEAARNVAGRLDRELTAATLKEAKDIRDCVATHSSVVEHYWQERHRLQRQCEAIAAIIEVLEEEQG